MRNTEQDQPTPRQVAAKQRYENSKRKGEAGEDGFQIYEKYTGKLFRTYKTLDQAESFIKKFKGYELRLTSNQKKGNTPMSDETKKYKVLREVEIDGTTHPIDAEVELLPENASQFVEDGSLVEVVDGE